VWRLSVVAFLAATLFACGSSDEASQSAAGLPQARLALVDSSGRTQTLTVELTCSQTDRERGLMFRESLPEEQGMLFFFPRGGSFWMKNTLLPLTAAFIDASGVIVHLEDMEPQTTVVHASSKPFYYGLEVNQGWFQRHGLGLGDRVTFPWAIDPPPAIPPACG